MRLVVCPNICIVPEYCIVYDRAEKAREDAHFHAKSQVSACFKASSSASDATTTSRIPTVHHGAESRRSDGARNRPVHSAKMLDTEDTNGLRTLARYTYSTTHTNTRYRY